MRVSSHIKSSELAPEISTAEGRCTPEVRQKCSITLSSGNFMQCGDIYAILYLRAVSL
jgi:hypothetical protein